MFRIIQEILIFFKEIIISQINNKYQIKNKVRFQIFFSNILPINNNLILIKIRSIKVNKNIN
jgi:hypothetical protein